MSFVVELGADHHHWLKTLSLADRESSGPRITRARPNMKINALRLELLCKFELGIVWHGRGVGDAALSDQTIF